ncbi:MAG: hypothetical protein KF683_07575 [Rubrivivax sp.]|nr:hypothetical protein [Rubrivivax sp.]
MAQFFGKHAFKVDRKGRISVPADFRAALTQPNFAGILAFPSPAANAIRCFSVELMEEIARHADPMSVFSTTAADPTLSSVADMVRLPFDSEGRVVLPRDLIDYAGIAEQAMVVGRISYFEIWDLATFRTAHPLVRPPARTAATEADHGG